MGLLTMILDWKTKFQAKAYAAINGVIHHDVGLEGEDSSRGICYTPNGTQRYI